MDCNRFRIAFGVKVSESKSWITNSLLDRFSFFASETHSSIMVKKNSAKAAPFLARSREDDIKRLAVVEEADAKWRRLESKKPDHALGAIEEAFISYSPMSDIVQEEQDDTSVDEILPFEETMSDSGGISEDGTIANSVGDVGKPAGKNIESDLAGINPSTEEETEGKSKAILAARSSETSGPSTRSSGVSSSSSDRNPISVTTKAVEKTRSSGTSSSSSDRNPTSVPPTKSVET